MGGRVAVSRLLRGVDCGYNVECPKRAIAFREHVMATSILLEDGIEIPTIGSLDDFRRWVRSDEFPERGRFDFINGRVEVDMAAEDLFFHSTAKSEISLVAGARVKLDRIGYYFIDRTRITCPEASLSVEPDLAVVTFQALETGRVRLVPKVKGAKDRFIEIEGGPDLVAEIVSDSSVNKDTQRLPQAYFAAGVREFWLIDVRDAEMVFRVHTRGDEEFVPVELDSDGFQHSPVLNRRYRLTRERGPADGWLYDLEETEA